MSHPTQAEMRHSADTLSLTSLEGDADEFDRRMIQTARDERSRAVNDARTGRVQAFRKARTPPGVGVTLENLERHNAKNNGALGSNARVTFQSPPSSSGSTRSDPALNVPKEWGRKAKVKRDWMRTNIRVDENREPEARSTHARRSGRDPEETPGRESDADVPRESIEDSPLSHKSSVRGTPASARRRRSIDDFDMNEASLIASTPYLPRSHVLDNIREREIASLKEQGVTTSRLDRIRESSPSEIIRRPRSASAKSTADQPEEKAQEQASSAAGESSGLRLRKRTKSWQALGKLPTVAAEGVENSPIVVYKKSSETIGMVDNRLLANAQSNLPRPVQRKDDSHDLLRRLARASSTPSPGRVEPQRPKTAPARQVSSSSRSVVRASPLASGASISGATNEVTTGTNSTRDTEQNTELRVDQTPADKRPPKDVDATPIRAEHSVLNPKTPVVTGAWVDTMIETPGPSTFQRTSESSKPSDAPNPDTQDKPSQPAPPEQVEKTTPQVLKPNLPRSALEAIVEEARASNPRRPTEFGDSTINSLEELIHPLADTPEGELDEDTLGLDVPTGAPRNEAERRRREELLQIRKMDQRLRSTRTSLRDTSRGIRRVEEQIERGGEHADQSNGSTKTTIRECKCVGNGGHPLSLWRAIKLLFYDESLKPRRRGWGLTLLSIFLLAFLAWFVLENIACEIWGHHEFARSYTGYGVVWGAPEFPYVLPTMTYRAFIKPWWRPLWNLLRWLWASAGFGAGDVTASATQTTASKMAERILVKDQARVALEEEAMSVLGMAADEVVR